MSAKPDLEAAAVATGTAAATAVAAEGQSDIRRTASIATEANQDAANQSSVARPKPAGKKTPVAPGRARGKISTEELLASFEGTIARTPPTLGYRVSALLVAIVMLVLPILYLALIALAGYAVYYHAVNHTAILGAVKGRAAMWTGLVYLAPIVVGPVMILFMIKPLFARSDNTEKSRSLTRQREPKLFAFVDKICEQVKAPRPKRIDVDCQVNASARFRRGVWSMFGNDLVLTIGLPLAAGLSMREFGGVLAHEFGHFAQGAGMRLSYLIRTISYWFVRVVYERDSWDAWLENAAGSLDIRIGWVLYLAMLMVWLTRKVLWVLMHLGFLVAGVLLRQMEFDADRYEARLAGSDTFEATVKKLHQLNLGFQRATSQLGESYRENRLGDDLPALIQLNSKRLPSEAHQWIDKVIAESKTGLFDTHPCDRERVEAAQAEEAPGIFRIDLPATELFSDFDAQSKATSWEFYRSVFGNHLQRNALRPVEQFVAQEEREEQSAKSFYNYTQGLWRMARPIALQSHHLARPSDPQATADRLKKAREKLVTIAEEARGFVNRFDEADKKFFHAELANGYLRAGFKLKPENFGPECGTKEGCVQARQSAQRELQSANAAMETADRFLADRLFAALELLQLDRVASRIPEGLALREQVEKSMTALAAIQGQAKTLFQVRNQFYVVSALLQHLDSNRENQTYVNAITSLVDKFQPMIPQVRELFLRVAYPFEHGHDELTLGAYLIPDPPSRDTGSVLQAASELNDRLPTVYHRILAQLAAAAEQVENALGLPPLEPPPEPQENKKEEAAI